jgi:hypothetical protein
MSYRPAWFQSTGVLSVDVARSNELGVRFDDGIECVLNFSDATEGGLQADLADIDFLRRVNVDSERRMLVWPNGFEMDLDTVHATATLRQRELTLGPQHAETLAACLRLAYLYLVDGDTEAAMDVGKPFDEAPAEVMAEITKRLLADLGSLGVWVAALCAESICHPHTATLRSLSIATICGCRCPSELWSSCPSVHLGSSHAKRARSLMAVCGVLL